MGSLSRSSKRRDWRCRELSLQHFTHAMSGLGRIDAMQVRATIAEFLGELAQNDDAIRGGLGQARELLEQHVAEGVLSRILDDAETPTAHNVWQKLTKVDEEALADFLTREHPQTAAVVVSKFSPEHAARILNRLEPDLACDVVTGLSRAASLNPNVIAAIGNTLTRDFLASQPKDGRKHSPADKLGAIMNFTSPSMRDHILSHIETEQPEFVTEIRRKMFTIEDIPSRVDKRGASVIVRSVERETLLRALYATGERASEIGEFLLGNISSRMAEQLREELKEITTLRAKDGEDAQSEVIRVIRDLVARGEIAFVEEDDG